MSGFLGAAGVYWSPQIFWQEIFMRKSKYSDDPILRRKLTVQAYRQRNPDAGRIAVKRWKENNPERAKEVQKKSEAKESSKVKRRARQHAHYVSNRLKAIKYLGGKCQHCGGVFHHSAMDFHHVNPDEKEIKGKGILANCSWDKILVELKKTILLCANCHRYHHYSERNSECDTTIQFQVKHPQEQM